MIYGGINLDFNHSLFLYKNKKKHSSQKLYIYFALSTHLTKKERKMCVY